MSATEIELKEDLPAASPFTRVLPMESKFTVEFDPVITATVKYVIDELIKLGRIRSSEKQKYINQFSQQLSQLEVFDVHKLQLKAEKSQRLFARQLAEYIKEKCPSGDLEIEDFIWTEILRNNVESINTENTVDDVGKEGIIASPALIQQVGLYGSSSNSNTSLEAKQSVALDLSAITI